MVVNAEYVGTSVGKIQTHIHLAWSKKKVILTGKNPSLTITQDGWLSIFNNDGNGSYGVYINGVRVNNDDGDGGGSCGMVPVQIGDVVSGVFVYGTRHVIYFIPYKD